MKRVILTFLFSAAAFFGLVATSVGQDDSFEANKQRWDDMGKDERTDIVNAYRHWKALNQTGRDEIAKRYEQFRALSDEEKVNVAVNLHRFRQLPPERREMLRRHLHAGPDMRNMQLCVMRIVANTQDTGVEQPIDKQVLDRRFREMRERYLDEVVYPALTEIDRVIIDTMPSDQSRDIALMIKMKEEISKNAPPDIGQPGSLSYETWVNREVMQCICKWIAEQLPPGTPEMAFYIRTHAFSAFPREKMMEILQAKPDTVQSKAQALAQTDEMKQIIAGMPEELRAEYEGFNDQQKLRVLVMAFRPFAEAGPRMFRHRFEQQRRGPMPPPPHGEMQPHPGDDRDREGDRDHSEH